MLLRGLDTNFTYFNREIELTNFLTNAQRVTIFLESVLIFVFQYGFYCYLFSFLKR